MKKFILLLTLTFIFTLVACAPAEAGASKDPVNSKESSASPDPSDKGNEDNEKVLDGTLEAIIEKLYETAKLPDSLKSYVTDKESVPLVPITKENMAFELGKDDFKFKEAVAASPMIQPSTFSLCLVRVNEGDDVEQFKTDVKNNLKPNKWVCMSVQDENYIVDSIGDVIFIVMSDEGAKPLHDAFIALK